MKPCPSPNCGLTDDHKLDYSDPNVNVLGRNGQNQVTCICGVRGPWADSYEEAVALWDALPRQEDVDKLRALLRDWDAVCKGHCDVEEIAAQVAEVLDV